MENLEKLSDEQLISLFQNNKIDKELKSKIISEIDKRDLSAKNSESVPLDFKTKMKILFTSYFLYKRHVDESALILAKGDRKGYKLYWRYFIYGIIFYTIVFFLVAKYVIKPQMS